jgi:hypothetical protein
VQARETLQSLVQRTKTKLGYQPVNGGLLGTGFEQWFKLERYLSGQSIRISKLLVLFISDDYARGVWNFSPSVLQCLSDLSRRQIDASIFYRLPPEEELSSWIGRIRTVRAPMLKMKEQPWIAGRVQTLVMVVMVHTTTCPCTRRRARASQACDPRADQV